MLGRRIANGDAFRHAIERMDPVHYLTSSYYEHWLTGVATLLVERGVVTRGGARMRAPEVRFPLAGPVRATDVPTGRAPDARRASRSATAVRVRNLHPVGHTRCPRYVRGTPRHRRARRRDVSRFPTSPRTPTAPATSHAYGVRFAARELWGPTAGASEAIHVDLWEH